MRALFVVVCVLALAGCLRPTPEADAAAPLEGALAYLARLRGDGAFPADLAPYVVEAAWAADLDPGAWPVGHPVLQDVVVPEGGALLPALRPLYALALADAPGVAERRVRLLAGFDDQQFGQAALLNDDAFALLALYADGEPNHSDAVRNASTFLLANGRDGGWSYVRGGPPGTDSTGMVIAALAASGRLREVDEGATLEFIASATTGRGYSEFPEGKANCDSTVWAIRTIAAFGMEAPDAAWDYLESLQNSDGGLGYQVGQASNALCTAEAATLWGLRQTGRLGPP